MPSKNNLMQRLFGVNQTSTDKKPTYKEWWTEATSTYEDARHVTVNPRDETDFTARGMMGDSNSPGAVQLVHDLKLTVTEKVLEIGCGCARLGKAMTPMVGEWHGVDISRNMLDHGRARCAEFPNAHFHEVDDIFGLRTLFADETFDAVYSTVVLMHLEKEDALEYIEQAFRITKVGGRAYFDTWNIAHPDSVRIWRAASTPGEPKIRGRIHCSSAFEFETLLCGAGWQIDQIFTDERLLRAYCTKTVKTVPSISDDGVPPFGYIFTPESYAAVERGVLRIEGCALDNVTRLEVLIDGNYLGEADLGHESANVAEAFPRYPESANCRFVFDTDVTELAAGEHELTVLGTDRNGVKAPITGLYYAFKIKG